MKADLKHEQSSVKDIKDMSFGESLIFLWKKRESRLASDFAVAGWLLSIDRKVFEDAKKNYKTHHVEQLKSVANRLFMHFDETIRKVRVKNCMDDFLYFRSKTYAFDNDEWWESDLITQGKSYEWHLTYTSTVCKDLSFVACRVTSKILGISSCERQWGDVKQIKMGKDLILTPNIWNSKQYYMVHIVLKMQEIKK